MPFNKIGRGIQSGLWALFGQRLLLTGNSLGGSADQTVRGEEERTGNRGKGTRKSLGDWRCSHKMIVFIRDEERSLCGGRLQSFI